MRCKASAMPSTKRDESSMWVKDSDHPYTTPEDKPFTWIQWISYSVDVRSCGGGKATACLKWIWRPMQRMAMAATGLSGTMISPPGTITCREIRRRSRNKGRPCRNCPMASFMPGWEMNDAEKMFKAAVESEIRRPQGHHRSQRQSFRCPTASHRGTGARSSCQNRSICERGCSYGANYTSLSAALPAAERTGNLTIVTDCHRPQPCSGSCHRQNYCGARDRCQEHDGAHL